MRAGFMAGPIRCVSLACVVHTTRYEKLIIAGRIRDVRSSRSGRVSGTNGRDAGRSGRSGPRSPTDLRHDPRRSVLLARRADFLGVVQRPLADAGAGLLRLLPVRLARNVRAPEGPGAALAGADGVDQAADLFAPEDAGVVGALAQGGAAAGEAVGVSIAEGVLVEVCEGGPLTDGG